MKSTPVLLAMLSVVLMAAALARAADAASPSGAVAADQPAKTLALDLGQGVTMKLVQIPAGTFTMGTPPEKGRLDDEGPPRDVTITKPFYLGAYVVTQEQYEAVMGKNPSYFKGPQNPVTGVSWDEAREFCRRLAAKSGKQVHLPTEAQWEYACRAGSKTRFYFGDDEDTLSEYGWYIGNSKKTTHPVGEKKPNAWGLYDMHGQVWQWCWDFYGRIYDKSQTTDPQGPASGKEHVLRGGSWGSLAQDCRSARRTQYAHDYSNIYIGLRVALSGVDPD